MLIAALVLTPLPLAQPLLALAYALAVAVTFASFGCIVGLWAKSWEAINTVNIFVLDPLVLLGGVFYSLEMVRGVAVIEPLTQLNPFTQITEGFRSAFLGTSGDALIGLLLTLALGALLVTAAIALFRSGYHLKT